MKLSKFIFITLMLFLLPAYSYSSNLGALRISLTEGNVQLKTEDTSEWLPAAINMPLRDGDRLWVPESGRLEIQLSDGSFLRLDENSSLVIYTAEKDSFQFYLTQGHAYINFRGLKDSFLQIDTPISSVRAYDRSNFRIDVSNYDYTEISVFKGVVYAESRNGKTRVRAGKTLSIREDNYADISPLNYPDEWERWNRDRDRKFEVRRYSSRYLPEELKSYSYDFDENGRWVYVREYGYVWTPTVIVSAGWAPYRIGKWTWIGGDYVWVSYEPWGWVPYHYGRWTFTVSIGWCWVPPARGAVYWGPGFVGWVHTPAYVAWVPLAPHDIYYGYGYYGPRTVNIININIHKTVINKVYKNVYVDNAVTVVHNDTFIRGKHVAFKIKKNPFLLEKISIGRPKIKPGKLSFMPIIKEISHTKQPHQTIRKVRVRELNKRRTLVKERLPVRRPELHQKFGSIRNTKETTGKKIKTTKYRSGQSRQIQIIEKHGKPGYDSVKREKRKEIKGPATEEKWSQKDFGFKSLGRYQKEIYFEGTPKRR